MDSILDAIIAGQPEEALIRLWVKAEATVEGAKQASIWQTRHPQRTPLKVQFHDWLEDPHPDYRQAIAQDPLALFEALDTHLHQQGRDWSRVIPTLQIEGTPYALIRRAFPRNTSARSQPPNPGVWCRHHNVIPLAIAVGNSRVDISVVPVDRVPPNMVREINCRLSHFNDQVLLLIEEDTLRGSFLATGLSDENLRRKTLIGEMEQCARDRIHLWVAPELTAPLSLQDEVGRRLAAMNPQDLLLGVPGTFHWQDANGNRHNTAQVFNGNGSRLPKQHKLTQFSYRKSDEATSFHEDILASRCITLLNTPLGLVGVAICKDFSDASAVEIKAAWDLIAPDWMLVPSCGDSAKTLKLHHQRAEEHWTLRAIRSLVANQELSFERNGRRVTDDSVPGFLWAAEQAQPADAGGSTLTTNLPQDAPQVRPATAQPKLQRIK
jgi:hypothetical protein